MYYNISTLCIHLHIHEIVIKIKYMKMKMYFQHRVTPKKSRLVGFPSGDYHGVEALTQGRRCALAIWYTLDAESQDISHQIAQGILDALPGSHT